MQLSHFIINDTYNTLYTNCIYKNCYVAMYNIVKQTNKDSNFLQKTDSSNKPK